MFEKGQILKLSICFNLLLVCSVKSILIIKITISALHDWFKNVLFPTNSLAKLLSDSLLLDSLLSDSLISQSRSKM